MFGRKTKLPRLTAYYGDQGTSYIYSGIKNDPLQWSPTLSAMRAHMQSVLGLNFNAVLANRYADGSQHMGYHADDEPELGINPVIGSLSFGDTRRFLIKSVGGNERHKVDLESGSLLLMAGTFQHHYQHALGKTKRQSGLRINLTFRLVV